MPSMVGSATPRVIHALFTQAKAALPNSLVYIGFQTSESPGPDVLMIGVDDPTSPNAADSADAAQSMATLGTGRTRDHEGTVTCAALSWNGNRNPDPSVPTDPGAQAAAMDSAYAQVDAVAQLLHNDPTLGVGTPGYVVCQITSDRLTLNDESDWVYALVVFTISFRVRI